MCRWFRVVMDVVRWRLAWSSCFMSLVISLTYRECPKKTKKKRQKRVNELHNTYTTYALSLSPGRINPKYLRLWVVAHGLLSEITAFSFLGHLNIDFPSNLRFSAHHLFGFLRLVFDVFDFAKQLLDGNLGLFQGLKTEKYSVNHVMFNSKPTKANDNC